ncbi:MAG TPA: DNA gyrase subunit A [Terracidiphilus sp.]|jgi:DNA gyrase subunit A|nr:DNA gyrase subunit A [Terracidiphilus sp.]
MADDQNPQLPLNGGTPPNPSHVPINIEEEMRHSYLAYSMSVIIGRALPDARDGLKPVHRRILTAMDREGLQHNKRYSKCAGVVGECLKKYHPHGDSSVYDALVRMAQPWSLRYPLVDGQGNFGSVDGDPPAAYRYTECRMERIAEAMMADIDMETVDMMANFDETTDEPTVLPTRIPTLIVNGSNGIAVGMATNIPPHNLTEVVNAAIELVNNSKAGLIEVLKHVKGPDFPTGGFIYGKSGIVDAYKTGRGRFMMRAKVATESLAKERQAIIVTEIPYQVNKSKLIERIAELVTDKVIDEISDVRDESDRDGMRIVIELKRGAQLEIILNQLYKHTQMQESFSMIFLAVLNGQPLEFPLDKAIHTFINHRIEVVQRRTVFLLRKAREREHILEGYKIALDNLDTVIRLIRASRSRAEARENLYTWGKGKDIVINLDRERLPNEERGLTLRQVDAILELQLYRLTQLSVGEILNELKEIRAKIAEYEEILGSDKKLRAVIVKELEEVRDKFGDARRTEIIDESTELQIEDLIADEQVAVTVSHQGYLKRTPISIYRQQRRGGTGRMGMKTREEDFVSQLIVDSTHAFLLCFTNTGRVYWLKVYEVPDVGAAGKGKSMQSLLNLQPGENVRAILAIRNLEEEGKCIFFATRNGIVKKTPLKDFSNVMARGIIAIAIDEDDDLVTAELTNGKQYIFLATREGMAIRFQEEYDPERSGIGLRPMGRNAAGNKGISLKKGDYVIGAAITDSDETRDKERDECAKTRGLTDKLTALRKAYVDTASALQKAREVRRGGATDDDKLKTKEKNAEKAYDDAWGALKELDDKLCVTKSLILTVTENGFGKRTDVDEYRLTARGAQGVNNLKATPKVGKSASILLVNDSSELMVISQFGKIIRIDTKQIRAAGRATQGVRLLNLEDDDKVAAAVIIPPDELAKDDEPTLLQ